jgi:uncharacterized membrane protein YgcG
MIKRLRLISVVPTIAILACLAGGPIAHARAEGPISLDLKSAPMDEAMRELFKGTDESFVLDPRVVGVTVNVRLKNVSLEQAVGVICSASDLTCEIVDDVWMINPRADGLNAVTIGGRRVPVVGAVRTESALLDPPTVLSAPSVGGLVDLTIEAAPLSDALDRLSKVSGLDIRIHNAVPKDLRVTAKVYMVPPIWLLEQIAVSAGLQVQMEQVIVRPDEDPLDPNAPPGSHRVSQMTVCHVIPRPELSVSGTGAVGEARTSIRRTTTTTITRGGSGGGGGGDGGGGGQH